MPLKLQKVINVVATEEAQIAFVKHLVTAGGIKSTAIEPATLTKIPTTGQNVF